MERKIDLNKITDKATTGFSYTYGQHLLECCVASLLHKKHENGVPLSILNLKNFHLALQWDLPNEAALAEKYPDNEKASDHAAECLSLLVAMRLTKHAAIERSVQKSGFDYWLGDRSEPLFQRKTRLAIASLPVAEPKEVEARFKQEHAKLAQPEGTENPSYVSVVELSQPCAKFSTKP